jgi:uncharacterized protein YndB with AHSA1/START domain
VNPVSLVSWLAPEGMKAEIHAFEPREGGTYRMSLTYNWPDHLTPGKTSKHTDAVQGRFLELVPAKRIVQEVEFESEDPTFAGTMTMNWSLAAVPGGTEVTVRCENVPVGIRQDDHATGLASTLTNLAAFVE